MGYSPWGRKQSDMTEQLTYLRNLPSEFIFNQRPNKNSGGSGALPPLATRPFDIGASERTQSGWTCLRGSI